MDKKILATCSICGGKITEKRDDLIIEVKGFKAILENAVIGECEVCGERYHPAQTALRLERKVDDLVRTKVISKSDLKTSNIVSADRLVLLEGELGSDILARVKNLEESVRKLQEGV